MFQLKNNIYVTKPYLPKLDKYVSYLEKIWESNILTNNGPLVRELEEKLKQVLGVKHIFFVTNGTVALQLAIKALDIKKEIITTPFTYVATLDSILWQNCKPIFVDINESDYCINVSKIEEKITKNTDAILAVHVFGNPCNVKEIEKIAKKNKLKVIYDGAHAFGTRIGKKSILNFGDISTLSFHATKLFHTGEGGAIITNNDKIAKKIYELRSFGHPENEIVSIGINGKNSELHAAIGLSLLPEFKKILEKRKVIHKKYTNLLKDESLELNTLKKGIGYGYAYFPVLFKSEKQLIKTKQNLENYKIFPRRYFYPSLNKLKFAKGDNCPVSESVSKRILCLPFYPDLKEKEIGIICGIIKSSFVKTKLPIVKDEKTSIWEEAKENIISKRILGFHGRNILKGAGRI